MGDMIDRDEALKAVAENNVVTAIRMIRALPAAEPAEDALRGALREAWQNVNNHDGIVIECHGDDAAKTWNALCALISEAKP